MADGVVGHLGANAVQHVIMEPKRGQEHAQIHHLILVDLIA